MILLALSSMDYGFEETNTSSTKRSWKSTLFMVGTVGLAIHVAYLYGKQVERTNHARTRIQSQQEAARLRQENERLTQENNQLKSSLAQEQQRRFTLEQQYGPSSAPPPLQSSSVHQDPWWKRLFGLSHQPKPPPYSADGPSCQNKSTAFWGRPR